MKEYDFTLKFALKNPSADLDACVEKLYESGCDDAVIGVGKTGHIALNFIREAASAFDAVSSAIADVKRAIPGCTLTEAGPDFVGLTDVANLLGCSRQNIRKLVVTSEPDAPPPAYSGTPSIWHLSEVLTWLRENKAYEIDEMLLEVARTSMDINTAKSWQKVEPSRQQELNALLV